jgi:hypothetical protein
VWRESALGEWLYNAAYTELFNRFGYKSSLFDSIVLNGKTIGEFHARNAHQTCVMVHYGQLDNNSLVMWIDTNADEYQKFASLFESGNGVTVEIKSGFMFPTGVKTMTDYKFVLRDGVFVLEQGEKEYSVYFDGQLVHDGDILKTDYKAVESSVWVDGTDFEVTKSESNGVVTFTVKYNDEQMSFSVEQTMVQAPDPVSDEGCGSSLAGVSASLATVLSLTAVMFAVRRKQDE